MVFKNTGLPEPPHDNTDDDLTTFDEVIMGIDTDTEEEDNGYDGYTLLPQGPEEANSDNEDEVSNEETNEQENSLPSIVTMESSLEQEVWGQPTSNSVDIEMDSLKVDEVKQAMSNFSLPPTSIPDWASSIPEELWKESLIDRLKTMNK